MKPADANATRVVQVLSKRYTKKGDMDMGSPEDTLLATLLSARTTDKQVLKVFPAFRKKFPTWEKLAHADVASIERMISTIGLYKSKAKAINGLAKKILGEFHGNVPKTMEELVTLPGVGRKTASCVISYAFGLPAIAVDTHVFRIVHRLGWTHGKTPERVEQDVKALVPKRLWAEVNRTMVQFGRDICVAGKPQCWRCPIAKGCAFKPKTQQP